MGFDKVYERPRLYPKQEEAFFNDKRFSLIEGSTKSGKALHVDSNVVTPTGMVRIGDIQVGDRVCDPNGGHARVVGVYPQGEKELYRVTFSDGASVVCCLDHLWSVMGPKGEQYLADTREIMGWPEWKFCRSGVQLGVSDFDAKEVPIDPYVLGVLIGDGGIKHDSIMLSSSDRFILDRVEGLCDGYDLSHNHAYDYILTARGGDNYIKRHLVEMGLWGCGSSEKFVPDVYKYNNKNTRLEVLRGIMDTDGWVNSSGQCNIGQTSPKLDEDISFLVESLGGFSSTKTKIGSYLDNGGDRVFCKTVYRNNIRVRDARELFHLPRKKELATPRKKRMKRTFRSIERVGVGESVCIKVDSENSLFMTDEFIVTHNTVAAICYLWEKALIEGRKGRVYWWVAPVSSQAEIAFRRMKNAIPYPELYTDNKNQQRLTLANDAIIEFKSADNPDHLYGEDVFAAVIDEASRVSQESWHAVRSTLTATKGPVRIVGNVKGKNNWFYKMSRMAEEGAPSMYYAKITAYDAARAGVIEMEEIESAKKMLPEAVFRELYLCEPSDAHGNPFGEDFIRRQILKDEDGNPTERPASGTPVAFGWDLGKKLNWTVGIGLNVKGQVCRFERFKDNWKGTIQRIKSVTGHVPAYIDSTGSGDQVEEELHSGGNHNFRGFKFSRQSKQQLMEGLAVAIQQGKVWYPDGRAVDELMAFEYEITNAGNVTYSAPKGTHDDVVDAIAMAYKMFDQNRMQAALVEPIQMTRDSPWSI